MGCLECGIGMDIYRKWCEESVVCELGYMEEFAQTGDFSEGIIREQLRCLWTAYCIRHDFYVDTSEYDRAIKKIWDKLPEDGRDACYWESEYEGFDAFDMYMCAYLV